MLDREVSRRHLLQVFVAGIVVLTGCGPSNSTVSPEASPVPPTKTPPTPEPTVASTAIPVPQIFETGNILQAKIPGEPFYFRSRGVGIYEIGNKFADAAGKAGYQTTSELGRLIRPFRSGLRADEGICNGVAAYTTLKRGLVPERNTLGGVTFDKHDIMTIGGLLHYGDPYLDEQYKGKRNEAGFLHYLLVKYLSQGEKFIMDTAPRPDYTFQAPVDMAILESVRPSSKYQGWSTVELVLRWPDYLDQGYGSSKFNRGDIGYVYHTFAYEVDNLMSPAQGEYLSQGKSIKSMGRPNPNRFLVFESGDWGTRGLDENINETELDRIQAHKVQARFFTKSMVEAFNKLAGPAVSLQCVPADFYCRP